MDGIEINELVDSDLRIKATAIIQNIMNDDGLLNNPRFYENMKMMSREIVLDILGLKRDVLIEFPELKTFDNYVYVHSMNVAVLGGLICRELGLHENLIQDYVLGAMLHDVGKIDIPKDLLDKKGTLTPEEFEVMKQHTIKGFKRLQTKSSISPRAFTISLQHHEAYDGSGYPRGRKKEEIHIFSRVATVVDIFDALTSDRPYKSMWTFDQVIDYLKNKIKKKLDTQILEVFLSKVPLYPLGTKLKLSTGEIVVVFRNNKYDLFHPQVRIIADHKGMPLPPEAYYELNLNEYPMIKIKEIVD